MAAGADMGAVVDTVAVDWWVAITAAVPAVEDMLAARMPVARTPAADSDMPVLRTLIPVGFIGAVVVMLARLTRAGINMPPSKVTGPQGVRLVAPPILRLNCLLGFTSHTLQQPITDQAVRAMRILLHRRTTLVLVAGILTRSSMEEQLRILMAPFITKRRPIIKWTTTRAIMTIMAVAA